MQTEIYQEIAKFIRTATDGDKEKLPIYSYSRLDTFRQCQYRFYLKYRKEIPSDEKAVALEVGTLCHSILEQRGNAAIDGLEMPTSKAMITAWNKDYKELKEFFKADWTKQDKTGRDYNDKFQVFWSMFDSEMTDRFWRPIACEKEFDFVFGERFIIHGFIDRVDKNAEGDYKVTDYKTASHIYSQKDRDYALQMFIYAMACYCLYGKFPTNFEYDFVFFDEKRGALEKGADSFERCFIELKKLFNAISMKDRSKNFIPNRTPLCWWCPYGADKKYPNHDSCQFYSEWKPDNKVFTNHKNFIEGTFNAEIESERANKKVVW